MKMKLFPLLGLTVLTAACGSDDPIVDNQGGGTGSGSSTEITEYAAPTYEDYYIDINDFSRRNKWNLANVHDPSVILADDGYYYMYQTDASYGNVLNGHGHFFCRRSKNLVDWEFVGACMYGLPKWLQPKLNEIRKEMGLGESTANWNDETQFGFWAPCVRKVSNGLYRMYYVITMPGYIDGDATWGERAFIGLMESSNIANPGAWVDKGYVLTNYSDKELNFRVRPDNWANCYFKYNAIDPSLIITESGAHWLVYGSWHSGFAALELNPADGMPKNALGLPWGAANAAAYGKTIYTRQLNNRWQASEAPEVIYHDGYYYLFIAYDELSIAYNTRVVRSKNIDGPYLDIRGADCTNRGGDAFPILTHPYKFGNDHGWVGISHCAVFDDGHGNWFYASQQRFPANYKGNQYSNALMLGGVRRIIWTEEGWPLVLPERYGAVPQSPITESELVGDWQHIPLAYSYQKMATSVDVSLSADHKLAAGSQWGANAAWSYDAAKGILTVNGVKLYVCRELDWEVSPRKQTIVYVGLSADGKTTYWGKKL